MAASVEFMKPSSRTIRREERRISLMSDSLISDGGVMAIGAGELMVVQYNHHPPHPVNPRRHWANRPDEDFLPARPLFYRMKNGLIRPLPDEKITATGQRLFLSYCGFLAFQASQACLISCFAAAASLKPSSATFLRPSGSCRLTGYLPWGIFLRCGKCLFRKCLAQFVGSLVYICAR